MKNLYLLLCLIPGITWAQDITWNFSPRTPGPAVYVELLGKGFGSANVDIPLGFHHRLGFGVTMLDYNVASYEPVEVGGFGAPTPSVMYYYLVGREAHFLELGVGASAFHHLNSIDYVNDSPYSLHGSVGYRYQFPDWYFFRIGFTPFKRVNNVFLPLVGVSVGYSW